LLAALVIAIVAGLWYGVGAPEAVPLEVSETTDPATETTISPVRGLTVHVSGAVHNPGLVSVSDPARVADVVAAAGGADGTADLGAINLAAPVHDGERVEVPRRGASFVEPVPKEAGGPVAVNQAPVGELESLPGIGPVLAARIVAHREANGPFAAVEDLLDVPGIGESKLAEIRPAVRVP
jgi:competence protein ComEA